MSLKAFHIVFITAAILLAFGFGGWLLKSYFSAQAGIWNLVFAAVSIGVGVGLIFYERYFLRKSKGVGYL